MKKTKTRKFNSEKFNEIQKDLNFIPLSERQIKIKYRWAMWKKHGRLARWLQKVRLKLPF